VLFKVSLIEAIIGYVNVQGHFVKKLIKMVPASEWLSVCVLLMMGKFVSYRNVKDNGLVETLVEQCEYGRVTADKGVISFETARVLVVETIPQVLGNDGLGAEPRNRYLRTAHNVRMARHTVNIKCVPQSLEDLFEVRVDGTMLI
jgi:hypothetical protein